MAAQIGYCGLDRHRHPLLGDEIRACWQAVAALPAGTPTGTGRSASLPAIGAEDRTPVRRLEFVEVGPTVEPAARRRARTPMSADRAAASPDGLSDATVIGDPVDPAAVRATDLGWSLWGDAEP